MSKAFFMFTGDYFLPLHLPFKNMTDEDFFRFCSMNKELRIERDEHGELQLRGPDSLFISSVNIKIGAVLYEWNQTHKLGETFGSAVGFELPDGSLRSANASWVTAEKWNGLTQHQKDRFAPFAPDFLVQLSLTKSTAKHLQERMHKWIKNGSRLGWLILPAEQIVFIYRADGTVDKIQGFDKKISGEDVLPGFEFDLSVLL